jgi:hypothetical protein
LPKPNRIKKARGDDDMVVPPINVLIVEGKFYPSRAKEEEG